MKRTTLLSVLLVVAYIAFWLWYTPLKGPLEPAEVEQYMEFFVDRGSDAESQHRLRHFLESDTGDDFIMFNVIELREPPSQIEGVEPTDNAQDVLANYMEYMWPALLRRACHPVLMGTASADALDTWGVEATPKWSQGAAMRYRSRRDMMEITTNPAFQGRHDFKLAAMLKTVAFPTDPWTQFAAGPRLALGMVVLILLLILRLIPSSQGSRLALSGRLR